MTVSSNCSVFVGRQTYIVICSKSIGYLDLVMKSLYLDQGDSVMCCLKNSTKLRWMR